MAIEIFSFPHVLFVTPIKKHSWFLCPLNLGRVVASPANRKWWKWCCVPSGYFIFKKVRLKKKRKKKHAVSAWLSLWGHLCLDQPPCRRESRPQGEVVCRFSSKQPSSGVRWQHQLWGRESSEDDANPADSSECVRRDNMACYVLSKFLTHRLLLHEVWGTDCATITVETPGKVTYILSGGSKLWIQADSFHIPYSTLSTTYFLHKQKPALFRITQCHLCKAWY